MQQCAYLIRIRLPSCAEHHAVDRLPHYCPVAAYQDWGLDGLVEMIWQYLRLIRIYTKPKVGLAVGLDARHHCVIRCSSSGKSER